MSELDRHVEFPPDQSSMHKVLSDYDRYITSRLQALEKELHDKFAGHERSHSHLDDSITRARELVDERTKELSANFDQRLRDSDSRYMQLFKAQSEAVQTAMTASEKAIVAAMMANEKSVLKAEVAADKRFEAVNEMRAMLNDLVNRLLPRAEADERFRAMSEKLDSILTRIERSEGSGAGMKASWGYLLGALGGLAALAGLFAYLGGRGP